MPLISDASAREGPTIGAERSSAQASLPSDLAGDHGDRAANAASGPTGKAAYRPSLHEGRAANDGGNVARETGTGACGPAERGSNAAMPLGPPGGATSNFKNPLADGGPRGGSNLLDGTARSESQSDNSPPAPLEEAFLTVDELAELLRLNRKTVYEAIARGDIPGARRIGESYRIHRATVIEWFTSSQGRVSHSRRHR